MSPAKEKYMRGYGDGFKDGMAHAMRGGSVIVGDVGGSGLRKFNRMWFNPASGHFVADAKSCFMWSESIDGPWHVVSRSTASERSPEAS